MQFFVATGDRAPLEVALNPDAYLNRRIGREYSLEGMLDSYTQRKNITVNLVR